MGGKERLTGISSEMEVTKVNDVKDLIGDVSNRVVFTTMLETDDPLKEELIKSLDSSLVGQDNAKKEIADILLSRFHTLKPQEGPLGVLFFSGPTGVGKTETVKALSKIIFGYDNCYIKIPCENLQQSHDSSKIFGAPPGYIGYNDKPLLDQKEMNYFYDFSKSGGKLNPLVKNIDGFNIILFDEIEKAHPDVMQGLLGLLMDGKAKLGNGNPINFSNSLVVFTSNVGQSAISENSKKRSIGFIESDKKQEQDELLDDAISKKFSPEFIGRVHKFINFENLTEDNCHTIISNSLNNFNAHLKKYFSEALYRVSISDEMYNYIIENGFSGTAGARDLNRFYVKNVEDNISRIINSKEFTAHYEDNYIFDFYIDVIEGKVEVSMEKKSMNKVKSKNNIEKQEETKALEEIITEGKLDLDNVLDLFKNINSYIELYKLHSEGEVNFSDDLIEIKSKLKLMGLVEEDISKLKTKALYKAIRELMISEISVRKGNEFGEIENSLVYKVVQSYINNIITSAKGDIDEDLVEKSIEKSHNVISGMIGSDLSPKQILVLNNMIKNILENNYNLYL